MLRHILLVVASLVAMGCIVEAPLKDGPKKAPLAPPAPPAEVKSGANFGDAFELVNAVVNPSRAVLGETVKVLMNFKVNAKVDRDYIIFVHVEDADGRVDRLNADHQPRKPTSQWQPGEVIQDVFDIPVPAQMQVRGLSIALGFWDPKSDQRLPIVNKDTVPTDGRDRLMLARFPVVAQ